MTASAPGRRELEHVAPRRPAGRDAAGHDRRRGAAANASTVSDDRDPARAGWPAPPARRPRVGVRGASRGRAPSAYAGRRRRRPPARAPAARAALPAPRRAERELGGVAVHRDRRRPPSRSRAGCCSAAASASPVTAASVPSSVRSAASRRPRRSRPSPPSASVRASPATSTSVRPSSPAVGAHPDPPAPDEQRQHQAGQREHRGAQRRRRAGVVRDLQRGPAADPVEGDASRPSAASSSCPGASDCTSVPAVGAGHLGHAALVEAVDRLRRPVVDAEVAGVGVSTARGSRRSG